MNRASFHTATLAFVTCCATLFACSSDAAPSPDAASDVRAERPAVGSDRDAASKDAAPAAAAKVDDASDPELTTPEPSEPVLASAAPTLSPKPEASSPTDLRSPSRLPDETPEINVAAFTSLPVYKSDKAPVGGAGASGIHLDTLEVGKGWAASRCEELGGEFEVDVDSRVNVCFRVVHPRVDETVTVEWARDGKVRQTIDVSVKPSHAYRTRAWLPVSAGRAGDWTATIKSEDGSVLGQIGFEIVLAPGGPK